MATLLISAAINIAIGLAINALFPPPDIEQEGPRLADLGFTSAAYGKFVNIPFGTDRMDGNIIDTTDPAIEEVVNQESTSVGKGGGQTVNTTTYTYFLTCRIAFCIEGAADLIRLWGDGKVVYDTTTGGQFIKEGWAVTFYPGGVNQTQDSEEVARRGSNIPAYRHLTTVKLDRVPLADFGNRIPNFTAEIAFLSDVTVPFDTFSEPAGLDPPGSLTGSDVSYMSINPSRDEFYSLKAGSNGLWRAQLSTMQFAGFIANGSSFAEPTVSWAGYLYQQTGASNSGPLQKVDIESGEVVGTKGSSGLGLTDNNTPNYGNSGKWDFLQTTVPGVGVKTTVFHACGFGTANGSITDGDSLDYIHTFSTSDGFPATVLEDVVTFIPDHDRGVMYMMTRDTTNSRYRVIAVTPTFTIGVGGASQGAPGISVLDDIPFASWPSGTGAISGWALNRNTGDIIMSNGSSMILYSPSSTSILATRTSSQGGNGNFRGRNQYYTSSIIGWMEGSSINSLSNLYVMDTRTLENIRVVNNLATSIGWQGGDSNLHEPSQVWDDRVGAIVFSRVDVGSNAVNPNRILKVYVNRVQGLGVGLDFVVRSLSTTYQRQTMAGLDPSDIDVTTLSGETVQGYTLTRKSTMKSALEPLRTRFLFDAIQSDWIMKFPVRGQSPVTTIPEEFVGLLKRGADQNEEPPIREVRADDLSMPMRLAMRYKNKDADYQIDVEQDKRHLYPNPTMRSKTDQTVDVPLVETPTNMKQLAQKQLVTIWNERVSYKTVIPWTYIKLDPTDVFNLGAFGETFQLRMLENNLGAGWAIEMTGVVEDTNQYSSVLAGGTNLGHITPTIPSGLPTRLFPLDAPLLSLQDLLLTPISNAYMAVGAYESSWPGASVQKSPDNVDYTNTGTVNAEAATAKVKVAPGAWTSVNGDYPNRIQEVADGGTMTISGVRRSNFWASATELNVLAGANHMAVIGDDGEVEIVGYIDVTDNGDNTFTLERLLRGRLGTEDIADGGMNVGDTVIGLSDSSNNKESGPIIRQRLSTTELNVEEFFRGVTIGTAATDADPISFTYTGRDLKPFYPVHPTVAGDGFGGLDVSWERRARGPLAAEWLDGTGDVVLNETVETYRVALTSPGNPRFVEKIVSDTKTVNFSAAEVALGGTGGNFNEQVMPANYQQTEPDGDFGGATAPLSGGWFVEDSITTVSIVSSATGISGPPAASGNGTFMFLQQNQAGAGSTGLISYELRVVEDFGLDLANILQTTFFCNMWVTMHDNGVDVPGMQVLLGLYDDDNNSLASTTTGIFTLSDAEFSDGVWTQIGSGQDGSTYPAPPANDRPLSISGVAGATKLRIRIQTRDTGTLFSTSNFGVDVIRVAAVAPAPNITVELEQQSETGFYSPINSTQVT